MTLDPTLSCRRRWPVLLLAGMLGLAACGKKGPPRAPIRLEPAAPRDVRLRQIGDEVVIRAGLPGRLTDGTPLGSGASVRILRMPATGGFQPGNVSNRYLLRQFERQAREIGRSAVGQEAGPGEAPSGGRLRFADAGALTEARAGAGRSYLYGIQVIDNQGRRSPITVPRAIEVVDPPAAPTAPAATTAEGQVRLEWPPVDGAKYYNVYRTVPANPEIPELPLNGQPVPEPLYVDTTFRYGETYVYFVRVLAGLEAPIREGASSPPVTIRPVDIFPPQPPAGLTAAAEGTVIRVYWFPNAEGDLGGYRVYRRADGAEGFALLGGVGPSETAFTDPGVGPGIRYHYRVTAIDTATPPNESQPSEERSEMLPPDAPGPDPSKPPGGRR